MPARGWGTSSVPARGWGGQRTGSESCSVKRLRASLLEAGPAGKEQAASLKGSFCGRQPLCIAVWLYATCHMPVMCVPPLERNPVGLWVVGIQQLGRSHEGFV